MPQRHRRPRGHIRELPSWSFQAIAYAGTDPLTGKLRYVRETTRHPTRPADPTTNELATAHNVSIATSHRAAALLNAEGLIEVSRGHRAVVIGAPFDL